MSSRLLLKELCRYKIGTFGDIIYRNALLYPSKEAFIYGSERITFSEFNTKINALIHALRSMGLEKGDVIGVLSLNCLDYFYVYGAGQKGGFITSPYNFRLQAHELDYLINYSEANTLFVGPELVEMADSLRPCLPKVKNFICFEGSAPNMIDHRDLLETHSKEEPDIQVEEDDPMLIWYTGGTTGVPRGALYTHRHAMDEIRTHIIEFG